jgi:cell wall-associated NlpC family hydrolase
VARILPPVLLRIPLLPSGLLPARLAHHRWLAAGALALASMCCQAAPAGAAHDPVMQLLQDRGLVQAGAPVVATAQPTDPSLLGQVREKTTDLVMGAMNFIGVRYRRGGTSAEKGFDCSGFTRYVFENSIGLVLPRRADEQARAPGFFSISKDELKPGDLVFFNTLRRTFSHVGIYVGDGKFIHSPRAGGEVRVEDMRVDYWAKRFNGARRAPAVATAGIDVPRTAP